MNWVGGVRQRVKQKNERKIQREFFERQRKARKVSMIKTEYNEKDNDSKKVISQDLLFLYPLFGHQNPGLSSSSQKRPVNFVDLSKPKHSRIQHHKLGPDSPEGHPISKLDFDQGTSTSKRFGDISRIDENTETPLPRNILERQIAEAEKKSKRASLKSEQKARESGASFEGHGNLQPEVRYEGRSQDSIDSGAKQGPGKERAAPRKATKRYFPQKPKTSLQENSEVVDQNKVEVNANKNCSSIDKFWHSTPLQVGEEFHRFGNLKNNNKIKQVFQSHKEMGSQGRLMADFNSPMREDSSRNIIQSSYMGPHCETGQYSNDVRQAGGFEVVFRSEFIEKKQYYPFKSSGKEKQFPGSDVKDQSVVPSCLGHRTRWNTGDLCVGFPEPNGDFNSVRDVSSHKYEDDDIDIKEAVNKLAKNYEVENPLQDSKLTGHNQSRDSDFFSKDGCFLDIPNCTDDWDKNKAIAVCPSDSPKDMVTSGTIQEDQQCPKTLRFHFGDMTSLDDDSEEDRFRQAMFKQRPTQQFALGSKKSDNETDFRVMPSMEGKLSDKNELEMDAELTSIDQVDEHTDASTDNEMPQSVPEAYAEVMEMEKEAMSDDLRSSSGDNENGSDLDPSMENKDSQKHTPVNASWETNLIQSQLETNNLGPRVTLASLGMAEDGDKDSCKPIDSLSCDCPPNCKATQTFADNGELFTKENVAEELFLGAIMVERSTIAVQTEDMLCHNCGCFVCNVIGEINTSDATVLSQKPIEYSAPVLSPDLELKLDATPELLISHDNDQNGQIGHELFDVKIITPQKSALSTKDIKVGVVPLNIEEYRVNDVSDNPEDHEKLSVERLESENREQAGNTTHLSYGENLLDLAFDKAAEESNVRLDSSPAISPCVIQTRSKTAKKSRVR